MGDTVIENPTWRDITKMIDSWSVTQMERHGLNLRDYDEVSALAHKIYYYLGYKLMPLGDPWSDEKIQTYNNWLIDGCPKNAAHRARIRRQRTEAIEEAGLRERKDINTLSASEKAILKKAFKGLMDRDPKTPKEYDPNAQCYFSLAGKHWFPIPTFCQHHIYGYLPWHRYQVLDFENALRSVPGCEEVTLPYWDIETGKFPSLLKQEPFASYKFPLDIYPDFYVPPVNTGKKGTSTARYRSFRDSAIVNSCIKNANTAPSFPEYNGITNFQYDSSHHIMRAHDFGHVGCGTTMANQDIAAFDPIFWFFHCNWDRLWWKWQVARGATDLTSFAKTLPAGEDRRWLVDPQMSISDPWGESNSDTIDLPQLGISYQEPKTIKATQESIAAAKLPIAIGPSWRDKNQGQSKAQSFTLEKSNIDRVSLRVKGINRIKIFGSFRVELYLGGKEVGHDVFFQSTFSGDCENCVAQAFVDFDFIFDRKHLVDKKGKPKEVKVKVINSVTGETLDFKDIGEPTINIRIMH